MRRLTYHGVRARMGRGQSLDRSSRARPRAVAAIVLAMALLAGLGAVGDSASAAARPTITLRPLSGLSVHAGLPFLARGVLDGTGARNNKTVLVQRKVVGDWQTLTRKRHQDDGRYRVSVTEEASGDFVYRTIVRRRGTTLARSVQRPLHVAPTPTAPTPPTPAPTPTPTPTPTTSSIPPANPGDEVDCEDFDLWPEANDWFQTYYLHYGDVAFLDPDNDLIPCESLAGAALLTSERPLDIPNDDAVEPYTGYNQGWWSEEQGHDNDGYDNPNFATGWSDYYRETRSFFAFYAPSAAVAATSLTLRIPRGGCQMDTDVQQGVDPTEELRLSAVTTDTESLVRGTAPLEAAFADLADGAPYAEAEVSTVQGPSMNPEVVIDLEQSAVDDFNTARAESSYFVIGGALTSLQRSEDHGTEQIFGCTGPIPVALDVFIH